MEPKDLITQLQQLKPSHNFTLHQFHPPQVLWDRSPAPKTPPIEDFPRAHWFLDLDDGIYDLKSRLGEPLTENHRDEARKYWDKVCNIQLALVPNISL